MDTVFVKIVYEGKHPEWSDLEYRVQQRFETTLKYLRQDVVEVESQHTNGAWHGSEITVDITEPSGLEMSRWLKLFDDDVLRAYREATKDIGTP